MAIPALTQLPLFVFSSMLFSQLTQAPSVLESETFLTLTSLVNPDPTVTIPILIGMITFANVESAKWFISDAQKSRQEKVEKWNAEKRARGETVIEPKKIAQNALRVMSVGRILIAAMVPGVRLQSSRPLQNKLDWRCACLGGGDLLARVRLLWFGANVDIRLGVTPKG